MLRSSDEIRHHSRSWIHTGCVTDLDREIYDMEIERERALEIKNYIPITQQFIDTHGLRHRSRRDKDTYPRPNVQILHQEINTGKEGNKE